MSDIKLVDVTIHIDKEADDTTRERVENALRQLDGVVSVHLPDHQRHLVVVGYNPDTIESSMLLTTVRGITGHAEMIGM